jgi:hypothetical protein
MSTLIRRSALLLSCAVFGLLAGRLRADEPPAPENKPAEKAPTAEDYVRAFRRTVEVLAEPIQFYREAMARKRAAENLRQLALQLKQDQPLLPAPVQPHELLRSGALPPEMLRQILPYMEQQNIYQTPLKIYMCPSDTLFGNRFGAGIEPVPAVLVSQLALPKDAGQVIGEVEKGKAADKAGLRQHDILLRLNGKDVPRDADAFAKLLADIKADKAVDAVVLREGKRIEVKGLSLPEGTVGFPPALNYGYTLPPQALWQKYIQDGTSNTIMLGEDWGGPAQGWKVWSKGDPILATTFRSKERFTTRQQEGTLVLTVVGTLKDGKAAVGGITVREGSDEKKYDALEKVPAEYRDKVAHLIEMSAK